MSIQEETAPPTGGRAASSSVLAGIHSGQQAQDNSRRRRQLTWTYRVVYQRADWVHPQSRYYTRRYDAARFANLLAANPTNDGKHAPIVSIAIDRRKVVTRWEPYKTWQPE